ncbi:MAG: hypothetical protein P4L65_05740 [Legionella sp.]|nr:hypothetical protein [Legionella sp.]
MSDPKSKLPDFKELASMTGKLFGDIKTSVGQIIQDYKELREKSGVEGETSEVVKPAKKAAPAKDDSSEESKK